MPTEKNNLEKEIRESLTAWLERYAPDTIAFPKDLAFELSVLFDDQNNLNAARNLLGREGFKKLIPTYLSEFSAAVLDKKMTEHDALFRRYIGLDKYLHLRLLIKTLSILTATERRGLLSA